MNTIAKDNPELVTIFYDVNEINFLFLSINYFYIRFRQSYINYFVIFSDGFG
jgi:hypothetical protein